MRLSNGLHKLNKDYGKGLTKLVKKETKAGSGEGSSLSVSHRASLSQLTLLAGRHKQIAVSLGNLSKEYDCHVTRLLEHHKTLEGEGRRLQQDLDTNIKKLAKSREKYERRQHESDVAEDNLAKAEPDARISRAELERIKDLADEAKLRASRARDEFSLQLSLTNKHQRAFYQEAWPGLFSKLRLVGREAEEGVQDLLCRLVAGGRDQWPESEEAWGELQSSRDLLDFKGDFSSFVILTKSGNPVPQDFPFSEPNRREAWASPKTPFGSLRRSLSRSSLRYRTGNLQKNSKFPSMFSLRSHSTKFSRKSFRANQSTESIDRIAEDDETVNNRNRNSLEVDKEISKVSDELASLDDSFEVNESPVDVPVSSTPASGRQKVNPFLRVQLNGGGKFKPFTNGYKETNFDLSSEDCEEGTEVSRDILDEVINNIDVSEDTESYDDRKNPFMDELYDESLLEA